MAARLSQKCGNNSLTEKQAQLPSMVASTLS